MLIFTFLFDRVAKLPTEGFHICFLVYSAAAMGLFVVAQSGKPLTRAHNNMVTKIYFPRLILPMSSSFQVW